MLQGLLLCGARGAFYCTFARGHSAEFIINGELNGPNGAMGQHHRQSVSKFSAHELCKFMKQGTAF